MNAVRRSDGLLSASQTIALLELIARHGDGCSESQVLRNLAAVAAASWSKARNTLSMLSTLGMLQLDDGQIQIKAFPDGEAERDEWHEHIGGLTAKLLADRIAAEGAARCIQARGPQSELWLDSMLLPGASEGLPLWVVEFSVASREQIGSRFWRISERHSPRFLAGVRAANRTHLRHSVSAAQLAERLAAQALQGSEAEEWVLDFERRRLAGHPLSDQIRRVSEENAAAGYDIASFSNSSALHHDLFIEVKSFSGSKRFFWTRNEITTAEEFGEQYSLYLVDIEKMRSLEYEPQIISGPYSALLLSDASGWTYSPTTFEFVTATRG